MKRNMTNHARYGRKDRLEYILDTIGFGEVVASQILDDDKGGRRRELTTTGVVMIKGNADNSFITAYICDIDEATAIWRSGNKREMPAQVYRNVRGNKILRKNQPNS